MNELSARQSGDSGTWPTVSVVIPNFNYGDVLSRSIMSVLSQDYPGQIEVTVVDDGSEDNSSQVLESFMDRVTVIRTLNRGQSSARNTGVQASSGELIALLDADDEWLQGKLRKQVPMFLDPSVGLVYSGITVTGVVRDEVLLPAFTGSCHRYFIRHPTTAIVLGGESTAVIRRSVFDAIGGFDTCLSISAGWDFYRRASEVCRFDAVKEPLARYWQHGRNASLNDARYTRDVRLANRKLRSALPTHLLAQRLANVAILEKDLARKSLRGLIDRYRYRTSG